jgi:XTP/dITP diphosphohydrolase
MEEVRVEVEQYDAQQLDSSDKPDVGEHQKMKIEEEIGDLLFSVINYARFLNIDPDNALARTNKKFLTRFQSMEKIITEKGQRMTDLTLEQMDEIWNEVKNH